MPRVLDSTYADLVFKAQEIFWLHGYKGVSVQELADHLDVSVSTIYNKYTKDMLGRGEAATARWFHRSEGFPKRDIWSLGVMG